MLYLHQCFAILLFAFYNRLQFKDETHMLAICRLPNNIFMFNFIFVFLLAFKSKCSYRDIKTKHETMYICDFKIGNSQFSQP